MNQELSSQMSGNIVFDSMRITKLYDYDKFFILHNRYGYLWSNLA